MYLLDIFWWSQFHYGLYFIWVDLNTSLGHHEPQEFSYRHPECTFVQIQFHVIRMKGIEGLIEVV